MRSALILKAMTSHDEPFNWEGEHFHYRHVNIWPRPVQAPHPPVWTTTGNRSQARLLGEAVPDLKTGAFVLDKLLPVGDKVLYQ